LNLTVIDNGPNSSYLHVGFSSGVISAKPWGSTRPATVPIHLGTIPHPRRYWYRVVCSTDRRPIILYFKYTFHITLMKVIAFSTFTTCTPPPKLTPWGFSRSD